MRSSFTWACLALVLIAVRVTAGAVEFHAAGGPGFTLAQGRQVCFAAALAGANPRDCRYIAWGSDVMTAAAAAAACCAVTAAVLLGARLARAGDQGK